MAVLIGANPIGWTNDDLQEIGGDTPLETCLKEAKEAGVADLNGTLIGQLAVVTGKKDISTAAKVVKTFNAEFDRLKVKFGFLNSQRLADKEIMALADLPSIEVLRGRLLGVLNAPATKLVRLLNTPASQMARVLQARVDKGA